jgi:membrane protein implicated in regulation of membrane protease activity
MRPIFRISLGSLLAAASMAIFLFMTCFASILGFALVSLTVDPKLTWMCTGIACASFVCSILIYIIYSKNDKTDVEEDDIGRTGKQVEPYTSVTVEYEVEKDAL